MPLQRRFAGRLDPDSQCRPTIAGPSGLTPPPTQLPAHSLTTRTEPWAHRISVASSVSVVSRNSTFHGDSLLLPYGCRSSQSAAAQLQVSTSTGRYLPLSRRNLGGHSVPIALRNPSYPMTSRGI